MYKATSVGSGGSSSSNATFVIKELDGTTNVNTTGMSVTTQGKVFRSGNKASSGIPIELYATEYIDGVKTNKIHEYLHTSASDFSAVSINDAIDISGRHISIESNLILEDSDNNDDLLLEDGTTNSPNSSSIGFLLADVGQIDLDGANDAHQLAVTPAVQREISSTSNNILTFNRTFDYRGVPYESHPHNQGFGLYKHKVDKRTLIAA